MHLSLFSPRGGGGVDTRGIRLQTNLNHQELDRAPKPWGGILDTSPGTSKIKLYNKFDGPSKGF